MGLKHVIVVYEDDVALVMTQTVTEMVVEYPALAIRAEWEERVRLAGEAQRLEPWHARMEAAENDAKRNRRGIWAKK